MSNMKENIMVYGARFSIVSITISALVLFVLSVVFALGSIGQLELIILSAIAIIISISTLSYAIIVLSSCDGLNAPGQIPTRTFRFCGLSLVNLLSILLIV